MWIINLNKRQTIQYMNSASNITTQRPPGYAQKKLSPWLQSHIPGKREDLAFQFSRKQTEILKISITAERDLIGRTSLNNFHPQ